MYIKWLEKFGDFANLDTDLFHKKNTFCITGLVKGLLTYLESSNSLWSHTI